jgi:hypothetical protein
LPPRPPGTSSCAAPAGAMRNCRPRSPRCVPRGRAGARILCDSNLVRAVALTPCCENRGRSFRLTCLPYLKQACIIVQRIIRSELTLCVLPPSTPARPYRQIGSYHI